MTGIVNREPDVDPPEFTIKDSGAREQFESGMVRDTADEKTDFTLALDGPMFKRLADHLTKGAKKYAARNWMLARGEAEYQRFRASALRHFLQWFWGDTDEDHAAAVFFNINGAEYVKPFLTNEDPGDEHPYKTFGEWAAAHKLADPEGFCCSIDPDPGQVCGTPGCIVDVDGCTPGNRKCDDG